MKITLIAAVSENNIIGQEGKIPWRLPADLVHFKRETLGKPIVMGRLTHEAIGRNLPNRINVVMSRNSYNAEGCVVVHSVEEVLDKFSDTEEIMIIGGEQIYKLFLPIAYKLIITHVKCLVGGDAYFPIIGKEWIKHVCEERLPDQDNAYAYTVCEYTRF
jgi:dihydrofolate reductase